ncbi:MAG: tRNA 2-thiouridine(34) synthase MnmA [Halieaceae bacterium]|jgi:tRNA-specific 2-thiouridylase|nr:tRNA 2-thiouridine(34) synthase MnmA [Halieaceae bacterium]
MTTPANTSVIVGMSGGVDSSVAALLLKQQGYRVEGLFMKNWEEDDGTEYCTAKEDLADAQAVADALGIRLHSANFAAEYWDNVFEHFLSEYRAGRTPNPDILCNREIKFRAFLDYAITLGADCIATGHYARRAQADGVTRLLKAADSNKDQTYFLHAVGHRELGRCLFPLGELTKPQVRAIAEEAGLQTHNKKDSTGICFIGERRFSDFLQRYLPAQPGEIRDLQGNVLGEHQGLMYHTIGQRQGLGIGGVSGHDHDPWYVVDKDLAHNRLLVAQGKDHPALYSNALRVNAIHWIAGNGAAAVREGNDLPPLTAKTRYRQPDQPCQLEPGQDCYHVRFASPQRAITPGQSVVFYRGEECLGGGIIEAGL